MNESKQLMVPATLAGNQKGEMYLIEFEVRCPICESIWKMHLREKIEKLSEILGAVEGQIRENPPLKSIRIDTSGWGPHALCGNDYARRIAVIHTEEKVNFIPWTEKDDSVMWGRLKHRQNQYHAWATPLKKATGLEALLDEQRDRRIEILGRQNTLISRERLKMLGLEGWEWKTAT